LGHPTPKFEHKIKVIEIQGLRPVPPSGVAVTFQQRIYALCIEIIE
jgi:hypothetical protein